MKKLKLIFTIFVFCFALNSLAQTQAITSTPQSTDTTLVVAPLNFKNKIVRFINKVKAALTGAFAAKQDHKDTLDEALNENFKDHEKPKKKPEPLFETEHTKKISKDVEEIEKMRNQQLEHYSN